MKLLPLILTLCSTATAMAVREVTEGQDGLVTNHTGAEFDSADSIAGANIQDHASSNPNDIFGLAVCPSTHPLYCSNGNFCCQRTHNRCCVIGATKFCCRSSHPYCGSDLRCYSSP